jgi:dTDP-glucose pyrophosphorylase
MTRQDLNLSIKEVLPELTLLMPMAGRGSRFSKVGIKEPKPLIGLHGRPFFWWAVESVRRAATLKEIVFVVLDEHCDQFGIHQKIEQYYPAARIVRISEITSGAAETAHIGLSGIVGDGPIAINDCDHVFTSPDLSAPVKALSTSSSGALLCFESDSPAYSYIKIGQSGEILGTVEKKVVSPFAIAGCYFFANATTYKNAYQEYQTKCKYSELFISGLFDMLATKGEIILKLDAESHCAFGTPEELAKINDEIFHRYINWTDTL